MIANQDTPDDNALLDEDLRGALLAIATPPRGPSGEVDFAILQMASAKMAAIRRRAQVRRAMFGLVAAAACVAISFTFLRHPAGTPPQVAAEPDPAAIILREVRSLFQDQIQSIQRDESGALHLTLADSPLSDTARAVVLEIRHGDRSAQIITFTGQTIDVLGQQVTVQADGEGEIELKKADGTRIELGKPILANYFIKARFI
jgi:hypothetical protein